MNRGLNRFLATLWRWMLIIIVYVALAVPVLGLLLPGAGGQQVELPMLFQSLLRGAANNYGFFPDNTYYEGWQRYVSAYAMNSLYVSLALTGLWNLLYAPSLLGRNHERSARAVFWVFAILHVAALLGYAFVHFTAVSAIWQWLIVQDAGRGALLLLPHWLLVPFSVSARLLCPYRIYPMFPVADRIRSPLKLRVYTKRGAR